MQIIKSLTVSGVEQKQRYWPATKKKFESFGAEHPAIYPVPLSDIHPKQPIKQYMRPVELKSNVFRGQ
jgi:hypothetical protein